ncbi:MAG: hypothetical protein NTY64_02030, partial [Deltaproteobacteria bacterium]|nr:hypothetical protein [Deltaproteobacteria bacterium]
AQIGEKVLRISNKEFEKNPKFEAPNPKQVPPRRDSNSPCSQQDLLVPRFAGLDLGFPPFPLLTSAMPGQGAGCVRN